MFNNTQETIAQLQAQIAQLQAENAQLKQENEELQALNKELSLNKNFNTLTRVAGFKTAERRIQQRRREQSGEIAMITLDIGGMGLSNSSRGEVATNVAMTALLEEVRSTLRSVFCDHQLNSGDEFIFYCDAVDADGVIHRVDEMAKHHGFEGAYCASVLVSEAEATALVELANEGMEKVYPIKKAKKASKSKSNELARKALADLSSVGFEF